MRVDELREALKKKQAELSIGEEERKQALEERNKAFEDHSKMEAAKGREEHASQGAEDKPCKRQFGRVLRAPPKEQHGCGRRRGRGVGV